MITAARCAVVMPLMDERGILWKDSSDLLLLFPDKFVYFYVFSLGLLLANQDTELTQIHSGRKAASRISRGPCGGPLYMCLGLPTTYLKLKKMS